MLDSSAVDAFGDVLALSHLGFEARFENVVIA
jgi:hypothetical protein